MDSVIQKSNRPNKIESQKFIVQFKEELALVDSMTNHNPELRMKYIINLMNLLIENKWFIEDNPSIGTLMKSKIEHFAIDNNFYLAKHYHILFNQCLLTICPIPSHIRNPIGSFYNQTEISI